MLICYNYFYALFINQVQYGTVYIEDRILINYGLKINIFAIEKKRGLNVPI